MNCNSSQQLTDELAVNESVLSWQRMFSIYSGWKAKVCNDTWILSDFLDCEKSHNVNYTIMKLIHHIRCICLFLICSNFNCILLPNYIPGFTIFSVSEFSSLWRMCCLWWQYHETAVIKIVYLIGQCPFSEHLDNMETLLHSENAWCCVLCQQVILLGLFFQWYFDCWSLSQCPPWSISSATPRNGFQFQRNIFFTMTGLSHT